MTTGERLESILPKDRIKCRLIDKVSYASDAGFYHLQPKAVVQPISEEEVKKVEAIIGMLRSSQAIIIVTPEYHSNISAALKNVMEYCGIDFVGKVTGIASTSTSRFGGVHASNTLQITLLNIGGYLLPRRLLVPEIHHAFDQDNEPVRDEIREQIEKFLNELLSYTNFMKNKVSLTSA